MKNVNHTMPKTAVAFAIKHKIRLGQWIGHKDNLFHIFDDVTGEVVEVSFYPTAKSAIVMMRRYLKKKERGLY